jgi:hypothetical protein
MPLQVCFQDDIAQGIVAVTVAMFSASIAHGNMNLEYVRGILNSARAQALNYGLEWPAIVRQLQGELSNQNQLLDAVLGSAGLLE